MSQLIAYLVAIFAAALMLTCSSCAYNSVTVNASDNSTVNCTADVSKPVKVESALSGLPGL